MKLKQNGAIILIVVASLAVAVGVYRTGRRQTPAPTGAARRARANHAIEIDQRSLVTAEQLVHLPVLADERPFAEDAMRIADNEMDLAFRQAVRRTASQPRATSDTAKEADSRLQAALHALEADEAQVKALTAAIAGANVAAAESLTDRLNLIKAQATLDQDDADDARDDLRRAGGDPLGRMQDMLDEHEADSKGADTVHIVITAPPESRGLIRHVQTLQALYQKQAQLQRAKSEADSLAAAFKERHDRFEARVAARSRDASTAPTARLSHDSSASLLATTQRSALDGKIRATFDQRIENQRQLSDVYAGWVAVLDAHVRAAMNQLLRSLLLILGIVLVAMLISRWIERKLVERAVRARTLHVAARVAVQAFAAIVVALVIFGPPDNLGTIVGLAGAGLTVALKDFILGFMGWLVLMGRNGIHLGDLVEINGVTGEAVELGVLRTVLLETGDWTDAGHPTGRRVTFNNSFAIEGHYFNFSTSGRWLWDDVRLVVPAGRDPYPIADALQRLADDATAESAQEAEAQWKAARRSPNDDTPSAGASVRLRPIVGGFEITVRYVTRVTERESLRSRLYRTAVDMLGGAVVADAGPNRT